MQERQREVASKLCICVNVWHKCEGYERDKYYIELQTIGSCGER